MGDEGKKNKRNLVEGDFVTFNMKTIRRLYIGAFRDTLKHEQAKAFLLLESYPSKAMLNRFKQRRFTKDAIQALIKPIYFDFTSDVNSYFLEHDREIREAFNQKHSFFIPMKESDDKTVFLDGSNKAWIQESLQGFFLTKNEQEKVSLDRFEIGQTIHDYGGYVILPEYHYRESSPSSLRGKIMAIWKKNKELDMSEKADRQKYKYSPKRRTPYEALTSVEANTVLNSPMQNLLCVIEWYSNVRFYSTLPLYAITPYSLSSTDNDNLPY